MDNANAARLVEPQLVGGLGSRYRRSERALSRLTPRGLVILPPHGGPLALTGPAVPLWELLADSSDLRDLAARLARRYAVPVSDVEDMLEPVLAQLVAAQAVDVA